MAALLAVEVVVIVAAVVGMFWLKRAADQAWARRQAARLRDCAIRATPDRPARRDDPSATARRRSNPGDGAEDARARRRDQPGGPVMSTGDLTFRRRWHNTTEVLPTDFRWNGRPLVVIDPEDAETLDALGKAWDEAESCELDNEQPMTMRALRMQAALRSLIAPPKPPEPTGLGAVVEDAEGTLWIKRGQVHWVSPDPHHYNDARTWAEIDYAETHSDGVTS